MAAQRLGSSYGYPFGLLQVLILVWFAARPALGAQNAGPVEMLDDAELTDVFFLDTDLGWAVGERGAIWHTEDGGRHWRLQRSDVGARLEAICFVDPQHGWAVGGSHHRFTHRSSAVVLRTQDGGRQWSPVPGLTLPRLRRVAFQDLRHGWAVGDGSAMYPSGIYRTSDGGRSWIADSGPYTSGWVDAQADAQGRLLAVTVDGRSVVMTPQGQQPSRQPPESARSIRAVCLRPDGTGFAAGQGGLVWSTSDGGLSWQSIEDRLPPGSRSLDLAAIAIRGDHVWMAGAPGSVVLYSPDAGNQWRLQATEQTLPIRSLVFYDQHRGWAAGSLGTILATRDGGSTWRSQRSGGTRAALLSIFSDVDQIPLPAISLHAGNDGYLTAIELLARRDASGGRLHQLHHLDQIRQAMSLLGATSVNAAWQFPMRPAELQLPVNQITAAWRTVHQREPAEVLDEYLVRLIRQWRPDVVMTEPVSPRGRDPVAHLTNQAVLTAVRQASDPNAWPEHVQLGLPTWTVRKVFSTVEDAKEASLQISTAQLAARLGRSVIDHVGDAQGLISDESTVTSPAIGLRLMVNDVPQDAGRHHVFGGLFHRPGGDARRRLSTPAAANLDQLNRAAQKRRNLESLLNSPAFAAQGAGWAAQLGDLTRGASAESAGQLLFQLAQNYARQGQPDLAADILNHLIDKYPTHDLAEPALVWLMRYYGSQEIQAWQNERQLHVEQFTQSADGESLAASSHERRGQAAVALRDAQLARSLEIGRRVQQMRPALFAEPELRFTWAAAVRRRGLASEAQGYFHALLASDQQASWRAVAQRELWLMQRRGNPPPGSVTCHRTDQRPLLDGQLDEAIWQQAATVELKSDFNDDHQWPATVLFAYDDQFLFLAVSCGKAQTSQPVDSDQSRPRDPDLSDRDRVELFLDIDRDYSSWYRLTVDHRGWVQDACGESDAWNPQWYVARSETDNTWTVEAAIALTELGAGEGLRETAWAVGLRRMVPGIGLQSATPPAALTIRGDQFSLLLFED